MERRFEARKQEILNQARIKPEVANGMLRRLEQFTEPFVASLGRRQARQNARVYISGLLSDLDRKNVESIAYRHDQDRRVDQERPVHRDDRVDQVVLARLGDAGATPRNVASLHE